jgi:hypothetical protein
LVYYLWGWEHPIPPLFKGRMDEKLHETPTKPSRINSQFKTYLIFLLVMKIWKWQFLKIIPLDGWITFIHNFFYTPIRLWLIISNFLVLCFISFSSGYFGLIHNYYIKNTNIRGKDRDFNEPSYTWVKYPDDFLSLLTYLIISFLLQVTSCILLKFDGDELL